MTHSLNILRLGLVAAALALPACADAPGGASPASLDELVVTDPSFDFSTTQTVQLELEHSAGADLKAVEISDAEGRRLMDGAFAGGASLPLKIPVGAKRQLTVRSGSGNDVTEQTVNIDANGRASVAF